MSSLFSTYYGLGSQPAPKSGKGKIFIIAGILLIISILVFVFSGMFKSDKQVEEKKEKKEEKEKSESKGDADVEKEVELGASRSCERNKKINAAEGSLGECDSVSDIDPVGVTFTGLYFTPKAPIRGNLWIHELSSTDDTKEYIAAHQSKDNYCKMVRFQIKKDGDVCKYKQLDAGYVPSPKKQSTSVCTNEGKVLGSWAKKGDVPISSSDKDRGYGIQEMKYNKFCG